MHINKEILFKKLQNFINRFYNEDNKIFILELSHIIIFNNPIIDCCIKGSTLDWVDLPPNKSLFHSQKLWSSYWESYKSSICKFLYA